MIISPTRWLGSRVDKSFQAACIPVNIQLSKIRRFYAVIIWDSFAAFCLVPILATRGQVSSLA